MLRDQGYGIAAVNSDCAITLCAADAFKAFSFPFLFFLNRFYSKGEYFFHETFRATLSTGEESAGFN